MMFGVHGAEKVHRGFVPGLFLSATPMPEQTVAEPSKHCRHPHRLEPAHPALVVQVGDIQSLVQAAFDAPNGPVVPQPLRGVQLRRRQARHQRDRSRKVLAQVAPQQRHLLHAGKVPLLDAGRARSTRPSNPPLLNSRLPLTLP